MTRFGIYKEWLQRPPERSWTTSTKTSWEVLEGGLCKMTKKVVLSDIYKDLLGGPRGWSLQNRRSWFKRVVCAKQPKGGLYKAAIVSTNGST